MEDSVMEPIASCGGGNLTRKPAKAAASRLKVNRILVPTNFSATSLGAVRYAASLAEWFGASVCLPHVVPCDAFTHNLQHWGLLGRHDEVVGMGERLLIKLACAEVAPALQGGTSLRVGKPAQEIVAAAVSLGMNLIILSIDVDSGLKHPLSSGVAEGVVRQQPCPTLSLHRELLFPARTAHPLTWSNILVPVDLTEFSRRTVKWAVSLAERLRAKITLRYAPGFFAEAPICKTAQQSLFHARESRAIELQLAEWTNLGSRGAVEVDLLPEMGRPDAHAVGQMLRRAGSDLIVTGIPRYSWWHNVVHSDSAEQLRRVAPCPVLSVPEKDLEHYADEIFA
jgi:nucleotide-binding universal stress UspA family protein